MKTEPNKVLQEIGQSEKYLQTKDGNLRLSLDPLEFKIWKVKEG
jgi:hypothetical protein